MSVSVLENRNYHEGLRSKPVLRCNNSRCISETSFQTSFHSKYKNKSRNSYQINTLSTLGMRTLEKRRNASLKPFAILNLGKPVTHTGILIETSSEVTGCNVEMAANELHAISNKKKDIKSKGINFDCTWNSRG